MSSIITIVFINTNFVANQLSSADNDIVQGIIKSFCSTRTYNFDFSLPCASLPHESSFVSQHTNYPLLISYSLAKYIVFSL